MGINKVAENMNIVVKKDEQVINSGISIQVSEAISFSSTEKEIKLASAKKIVSKGQNSKI